ncbi:MAG TPA: site-specific integrase [Xanthobacteraceae bacterium]|jgi:integrase|nr:site-specific integrase [Xanthobacteraceae bacterium]
MKQQSTDPMPPVRHLVEKAGWYHSRLVVPAPLQPFVGKKELWTALGTNTRSEANRRLPAALAKQRTCLEAALAEARARTVQTETPRSGRPLTPEQLALTHYSRELAKDDRGRNFGGYDAAWREESAPIYAKHLRRVASGTAPDDECDGIIGWAIDAFAANGNVKAERGSPEWRALGRQLAAIQLEIEKRKDERDRGEGDTAPTHPLLTAKLEPTGANDPLDARIIGPDSTKSLSEIVPDFVKERGASSQTDYESKLTARMFEEHLGHAKPLYRITRQDVIGFKRVLAELPANRTQRFGDQITVPDAIKANKARATPFPVLNTRTINDKYLSKLHSIFEWCKRNEILPDNPSDGIKIETVKDKGQPRRLDFSPSDLTKIFSAKRFNTGKPFNEAQWVELCALFTGARDSELAQIKLDSIRHERGILVIAIEEETKNAESWRLIPVHSTLISLGFEKRVAKLRASGATHLFPDWYRKGIEAKQRAKAGGKLALNHHFPRFIPRAFIRVIRSKEIGISDPKKVFYSFRHSFTTGLDRAGVADSLQRRLCGHADNSPHAGYVHGQPVEAMKEAIEKLRFDGFTL